MTQQFYIPITSRHEEIKRIGFLNDSGLVYEPLDDGKGYLEPLTTFAFITLRKGYKHN